MYRKGRHLVPEHVSAYLEQGNALFELKRYDESLAVYNQVITLDKSNAFAYLKIGDILTTRNLYEIATEYYVKALQFIRNEQSPDVLWSLVYPFQTSNRPAQVQFELSMRFVVNTPSSSDMDEALIGIGKLYHKLFDAQVVSPDVLQSNLQILQTLLQNLLEEKRAEALAYIANGDDTRIALFLIHLAPFSLSGLTTLAHQVTLRWVVAPRNDDLVIRFYHVLDSYGVPFEDSDWLFVQELMLEGLYIQVKSVLSDLVKQRPTSEGLLLLAEAMCHRHDPAQEQIEILHQSIASTASSDTRCGEAWKRIGELSLEKNEGIAAIAAFQEAERCINSIPQLELYRTGDWNALQGLHLHPDFAFPVVVVIDLECDYQPNAADGSRVFEIAAVRRKGHTELDTCSLVIKPDFPSKVTHRQNEPF